jgi:hypothetical protein
MLPSYFYEDSVFGMKPRATKLVVKLTQRSVSVNRTDRALQRVAPLLAVRDALGLYDGDLVPFYSGSLVPVGRTPHGPCIDFG